MPENNKIKNQPEPLQIKEGEVWDAKNPKLIVDDEIVKPDKYFEAMNFPTSHGT